MILDNLNEMQRKIVMHTEGAVLVLAGAGSGKTRVLTHRIACILENKLAYPSEVLAITFTNKAAGEMRTRLEKMGCPAYSIWAQTFHSFGARILRQEAEFLPNYNKNFSIYDEADKKLVLKKILKNRNLREDEYLSDLMHDISFYKNDNLTLDEYASMQFSKPNYKVNLELMKAYEEEMMQNNALDFDDLLYKTLWLLKTNEQVRKKYQEHFKYILIDEFQDTNAVQYEMAKILSGYHHNIFAVGDEDQSIYSWRGANINNIKAFLNDYSNVALYKLEQNYRSTKNILDCANSVIKHNENRIDKTLFTENEQGVKVEYINKYTDREEAEYVAQTIHSLVNFSGYSYNDFAVLMRLNALTRSVEDKLLSYGLPYQVFGGLKFYERAEIKNMLAYLKLLVNSRDNESFLRIVNFPKRNIGEASIEKLSNTFGSNNLFGSVLNLTETDFLDKTLNKFACFKNLMQEFLTKREEMKVSELTEYIIEKLDLKTVYDTGKDEDENRMRNLDELVASIKQFEEENENCSLEDYLQSVSLTSDIDTYDEEKENITLATVHSAKGLEFKVVFIIGLEEGNFPILRCDTDEDEIEEERRLMYVAITRAMERLYLSNSTSRFMYGKTSYQTPSRFLGEMGFKKEKKPVERFSYNSYQNDYNDFDNYELGYDYNGSQNKQNYTFNSFYKPKQNLSFNFEDEKPKTNTKLSQNEDTSFCSGDVVEHSKFGRGTVVSYQSSSDILTVNFEGIGNKVLSAKFAPIKKV